MVHSGRDLSLDTIKTCKVGAINFVPVLVIFVIFFGLFIRISQRTIYCRYSINVRSNVRDDFLIPFFKFSACSSAPIYIFALSTKSKTCFSLVHRYIVYIDYYKIVICIFNLQPLYYSIYHTQISTYNNRCFRQIMNVCIETNLKAKIIPITIETYLYVHSIQWLLNNS